MLFDKYSHTALFMRVLTQIQLSQLRLVAASPLYLWPKIELN